MLTCNIAQVGINSVRLTNSAGCDSIIITTTSLAPPITNQLQTITCDPSLIGTSVSLTFQSASGCDSIVVTNYIINPNGCSITASVNALPTTCPNGNDGSINFITTAANYPLGYRILRGTVVVTSGSLLNANQIGQASNLNTGSYTLQVFAAGDTITRSFTISSPPTPMAILSVSDFNGYSVPCEGSALGTIDVNLAAYQTPVTVLWNDGVNDVNRTGLDAGNYSMFISYGSGCNDTIDVVLDAPTPILLDFQLDKEPCVASSGSLVNVNAIGGVGPFTISLNATDITGIDTVPVMSNSQYTIIATDANGCTVSDNFTTTGGTQLLASISPDTTIFAGQTVELQVEVLNAGILDQIVWAPGSCDDCRNYDVTPFNTTTYTATLTDSSGCNVVLSTVVNVERAPDIKIPNVFMPSDVNNEFFSLNLPDFVLSIDGWRIFDRWGDQLWVNSNPSTERFLILWDGVSARGNKMNPGVYVYVIEGTKVDGTKFVLKGDVTLVR